MKSFYITTTLPYVNADPHIGFALEIIQADAIVRYQRLQGKTVFYNTGTDEHGLKIYRKAEERGILPQAYCDEYAAKFRNLAPLLHLDNPTFIRTTDEHHKRAAQEFWKRCLEAGDIYKKNYEVKYCVGCELEKTDSELVNGKCPIHPLNEIELIKEENYFFKFSKYQTALLAYYEAHPDFVVPEERFNEIKAFVKEGLTDFSISRLKAKMPWGVPVPDDSDHVMYVWFDALINYISTLNWPKDEELFKEFWPGVQVAGKDNLRQQSAMWQAMLLSAGLPMSKQIFIHGFITAEGQKMSKSLGNVVNPYDVVEKYGIDAVRFYLLGALPSYDDGDFSFARFEEYYTAHLVNGIGNLSSRILTMIEKYSDSKVPDLAPDLFGVENFWESYHGHLNSYKFDQLIVHINELVKQCDTYISETRPWELAKQGQDIGGGLYQLVETLRHIAVALLPIVPESAEKLLSYLGIDRESLGDFTAVQAWGGMQPGAVVVKGEPLFPRLEKQTNE